MKNIENILVFAKVVDLGSFSKAALAFDVSKSYISKKINALENSLQEKLLQRNTRGIQLTEAGEIYYEKCKQVVESVDEANNSIAERKGQAIGTLKITSSPGFSSAVIAPLLPKFLEENPKIKVEVDNKQEYVDIIQQGYDLALRSSKKPLKDSGLIAKPLKKIKQYLCATPMFLEKYGVPQHPGELIHYNSILSGNVFQSWTMEKKGKKYQVTLEGNVSSQDVTFLKSLMLENLCLGIMPDYMVKKDIEEGRLVQLFKEYELESVQLYALYPERQYIPKKVSLFLDALSKCLESH